eukprot:10182666-Prorocentrum_lima.AAC.1
MGGGFTPAPIQRTHGHVIQANSVVVPPLHLPVGQHRCVIHPPPPPPTGFGAPTPMTSPTPGCYPPRTYHHF